MKYFYSFIKIMVGTNLGVLLALMILPAFIVTDQLDVFERIISYISK